MPTITFIHPDGQSEIVEAKIDDSVMLTALLHGVDGIVGECGGGAVCATCHVYVDQSWLSRLSPVTADEDDLLEGTAAPRLPNSRLSCQIRITPELNGLVLQLPERQV